MVGAGQAPQQNKAVTQTCYMQAAQGVRVKRLVAFLAGEEEKRFLCLTDTTPPEKPGSALLPGDGQGAPCAFGSFSCLDGQD
ncbi:hypothetical protein AA0311_0908 [Asaia bogorensis NBRC 16594]|uniref:Uncharacterized protein n=1 Tax=Asaia bogorensis NBRC 16594 TaxID=1231624 RepID=A0AAN4U239_9PROT|nr:hypothetical protein AA0311_0908 [Asaia bogorensis NBRC 16594]GEL53052.1 hypothetical protein ABO01nite_10590 [Asaia bogorensis NBRC 16594]